MTELFGNCGELEIVNIDINEMQRPADRYMRGMFYDDFRLKRIKWGENTAWIPGNGTEEEIGHLFEGESEYHKYGIMNNEISRIVETISVQINTREKRKDTTIKNDIIADPNIYKDMRKYKDKNKEIRGINTQIGWAMTRIESMDKEKDKDKIAEYKETIKKSEASIKTIAKEFKEIEERIKEYKKK